ncbi:MAG: TerD family protein [Thermoguttaceae bacterium]|nr:TerD family protein [Thermoguttaceae bacterium]MBQ6826442.1 TerD family protein [Thermoguttaceae bacterium]
MLLHSKTPEASIASGYSQLTIGLGWRPESDKYDLDASCFLLGADGKTRRQEDCVYFNQRRSLCGSVVHNGDNLVGKDEGDAETIDVDLTKTPSDVQKYIFTVSIYEAEFKNQRFHNVDNVYIRVVDKTTNLEIARFNLADDAGDERTVIFGELYQRDGAWRFRALGQGFPGSLPELAESYGVVVDREELEQAALAYRQEKA